MDGSEEGEKWERKAHVAPRCLNRVLSVDCSGFPVLINTKINKCRMFRFSDGKAQPLAEPAFWMVGVKEEGGKKNQG